MQFKFFISGVKVGRKLRYVPHSLNHRLHWRARSAWTKEWKMAVWTNVLINKKTLGKMPLDHPTVKIIMHACQKMDRDNVWSASKAIIDGLKYAGVIEDDRNEDFECSVVWQKALHKPDQGVEVIIDF